MGRRKCGLLYIFMKNIRYKFCFLELMEGKKIDKIVKIDDYVLETVLGMGNISLDGRILRESEASPA
jgi:hypothetical protein